MLKYWTFLSNLLFPSTNFIIFFVDISGCLTFYAIKKYIINIQLIKIFIHLTIQAIRKSEVKRKRRKQNAHAFKNKKLHALINLTDCWWISAVWLCVRTHFQHFTHKFFNLIQTQKKNETGKLVREPTHTKQTTMVKCIREWKYIQVLNVTEREVKR